tara:strand:+ start:1517 stop:3166 length:1650 start_codon:yes stop_codon:yes gene_type:complete
MPPGEEQDALNNTIQSMARSLDNTNSGLKSLITSQNTLNKILEKKFGDKKEDSEEKSKGKGILKKLEGIPLVAKGIRFIGNQITGAIQAAFKMQEKSLAVGLTFAEMMDKNAEVTGYLTDGLTGFQTAQTIGAEMFVAGLRGNNKEIARLAVATKLTGGDSRKLLKGMAGLTAGMGFSDEQRSSLANTALSLSQQFGMSTDQLVGALGAITEQMDTYAALDIAPELQEGMLRLQAALGPELGEAGVKFANALLKPEAMVQASMLQIGEERRAISQGIKVSENIMKMVTKAGEFSRRQTEAFKGAGDNLFAFGELGKLFGKELLTAKRLLDKIEENSKRDGMNIEERIKAAQEQRDVNKKFTETWENFKGKILTPLMKMSMAVGNVILSIGGWLVDTLGPIVTILSGLAGFLVAAKGVLGIFGIGTGGLLAALGTTILPVLLPALGIAAAVAGLGWGISKLLEDDEPKVEGSLSLPSQPKTPGYLNTGDSYFMEMQQHKILMALEDNSNTNKLMLEQAELRVDQGEIAHGQNEQIINMNRLRPSDVLGVD